MLFDPKIHFHNFDSDFFMFYYQVLSQTEIDKYIRISINDFIPAILDDYSLEFDELGILKQVNKVIMKIILCIS